MKDNFPKIPQRFTDESIKSEIARLEKEIANCDAEITKGEISVSEKQNVWRDFFKERAEIVRMHTDNDAVFVYGANKARKIWKMIRLTKIITN